MNTLFKVIPSLLLLNGAPAFAETLLSWDLPNNSTAASSSTLPTPALGITGSLVSANTSGTGTTSAGVSAETSYWNRRGFDVTTSFADALAAGDYYSFTTTASAGYDISITGIGTSVMRIGSTGPPTVGLFYSADGTTFAQVGATATVNSASDTNIGAAFATGLAPVNLAAGETGHWRVVAFGGTTTTNGSRLRWFANGTADFTLTGTSTPLVAAADLVWAGTNGGNWNTVPANQNWADSGNGNAASAFEDNDNATISLGHTINVDPSGILAGNVIVNAPSGTTTLTGGSLVAFSLSKSGDGTLLLDGVNTFSAPTQVTGGVLKAGGNDALGAVAMNLDAATLATTAGVSTLGNVLSIGVGGATFDTEADVAFSAAVATSGAPVNASNALVKTGPGLLTLSGASLGSQMTFNSSGGAVDFDITGGSVSFSGSGARNLGGTSTWDGPVTWGGGTLRLHGGTVGGTGAVTVAENSTVVSRLNFGNAFMNSPIAVDAGRMLTLSSDNGTNLLLVNSVISGDGTVAKGGNGTVRMNGDNTYSGGTTLNSPTGGSGYFLQVGSDTALGTGPVTFNQGVTLAAFGGLRTLPNSLIAAGDFSLGGSGAGIVLNGALDLQGSPRTVTLCNSATLGGAISNGGLTLASSSAARSLTLTGTNIYTGDTLINGGILRINGDSSAATGSIQISGGATLGGNGVSGAPVVLSAGSSLAVELRDWTGSAGTGYDDLDVASLDVGNSPITLNIDSSALVNFSESNSTFTVLRTTGGISNFDAGNVTISTQGFVGSGIWSVAQVGNNLVLSYEAGEADAYLAWATGAPYNLSGGDQFPEVDADLDGIANAVEFVIGGNPANGSDAGKLPTVERDGTDFIVSFRLDTDAAYLNPVIEYNATLSGIWTPAQDNVAGVDVTTIPNGYETGVHRVDVRLPASLSAGGKLFARLVVTVP